MKTNYLFLLTFYGGYFVVTSSFLPSSIKQKINPITDQVNDVSITPVLCAHNQLLIIRVHIFPAKKKRTANILPYISSPNNIKLYE